ncbi:Tas retrotransposon peptidase A16 [Ancylostoma duodenale]|uniref:Tas retrotransposon peptidase A16 n=1 Tax=Ancylostoma duodenale TaxID=51022 RepID=A0A0C2GP65_9BILA|nr:Tas retrotransposon peptidase A16 [Ancylostoma duodenale]
MSAQLRRKIGIARKHLVRALNLCEEDLKENVHEFLSTAANDDLLDYAELQDTHHELLFTKLRKLEDLNKEWTTLMTKDPDEVTIFHDFISKYGDYRDDIQRAIKALQQIDSSETLIQEELGKRGTAHTFNAYSTQHPQDDSNASHESRKMRGQTASAYPYHEGLQSPPTTIPSPLLPSTAHSLVNPSTLRHLIYTQLSSLPQCDSDGKQLQDLYLRMLRLVRQYTAITPYSPEFALGALLYNKLPRFVRARIYDMTGGQKNLTPSELITLLEEIVRKESTLRKMDLSTTPHHTSYHISEKIERQLRSSNIHQQDNQSRGTTPQYGGVVRCPFCNRTSHNAMQCRIVQTAEERRKFAKTSRMCLKCLQQGHRTISCNRPPCYKCKYHHHPALCFKIVPTTDNSSANRRPRTRTSPPDSHQHDHERVTPNTHSRQRSKGNTRNEPPQFRHPIRTSHHAHLSDDTPENNKQDNVGKFQESSLSYAANLRKIESEDITVHTFGTCHPTTLPSQLHTLQLQLQDNTPCTISAQSLPILTQALKTPAIAQDQIAITVQDADIPTTSSTPGILIGMDHFWNLVLSPSFYSVVLPNGYHLLNTRLGKVISGKKLTTRTINSAINEIADHPMSKTHLDEMVERFWKCESLGTGDEAIRSDDITCLDFFNNTTRYDEVEQRYYTRLPFKLEQESVPDNFEHSLACLRSNWKTLSKKPEYLDKYNDIIQDQLRRGIIGKPSLTQPPEPGTFLSHHAVINESKKQTKIRLVYNGSARVHNAPSLNDCLYRGPVLLPDLSGILLRLRLAPILLISDIEKAYLMVGLEECDRRFTRFLWLKNHHEPPTDDNLVIYHFLRVPFGLICSAFLLAATIHLHLTKTATPIAHESLESCYVDNIFLSANSPDEAMQKYSDTKKLFTLAEMNAREWTSSDPSVNAALQSHEQTKMEPTIKVLNSALTLTLGSALMNHLTKELKVATSRLYIWSDSKTALQWTKMPSSLPVFVQNRVKAIRKNAPNAILRYVPTNLNPADSGSRGSTIQELNSNKLWWNGPTFLQSSENEWPEDKSENSTTPIVAHSNPNVTALDDDSPIIDNLMTLPTWNSLLRVMTMIMMFINNTRMAIAKRKGTKPHRLNCTQAATIALFRQAQMYNPISSGQKRTYAHHPQERVKQPAHPFSNSAVDYLGPFNIENHPNTAKVWIALFTCLNTRAIYVDIASSLSAICFLQILRRFIATNGTPRWLLSDNAPAFVTVSNAMSSLTKKEEQDVIDYCATHNMRFKFVAALAPWQGGVYERMIGIFKTSFKAAVRNRTLDFDEFFTLTKECEAIVNCRPLTYMYSDIDSGFPLRPIDFLRPHSIIGPPRLAIEDQDDNEWKPQETQQDLLQDQWNSTFTLLNRFWQRWHEEYLTSLRENYQHEHQQPRHTSSESPFDDQVVLVHDSTRPRGQWKLGRIMSHSDHSATIKLPNGHSITRPLNLLYPLEIPPPKTGQSTSSDVTQTKATDDSRNSQRETTGKARTHPMITRSLTRQLYTTILATASIISIVSADFAAYNPPDTKCDKYQLSPKHIIYSDQCVQDGIAIATTTSSSFPTKKLFCWFHISCPLGHIRIPLPFQPHSGYCGDTCKCPEWTNSCSHYNGKLIKTSPHIQIFRQLSPTSSLRRSSPSNHRHFAHLIKG